MDIWIAHILVIVNNDAMSTDVQISFQDSAFNSLGNISRSELLDHVEILFLIV